MTDEELLRLAHNFTSLINRSVFRLDEEWPEEQFQELHEALGNRLYPITGEAALVQKHNKEDSMRVICLISAGTVDECLVVNDDKEQEVLEKLANENAKLESDERIRIRTLAPTDLEGALVYIRNP